MALEGSSNEGAGTGMLYVGLENFKIIAVNPATAEAWQALGFNFEQEPKYVSEQTDPDTNAKYTQMRVDLILDNEPLEGEPHIRTIASYYVDNRVVTSRTGKTQYTNKQGNFAYLDSIENIPANMSWFNLDGARPAYRGEEHLMGMFRNFANVARGGECYLENPLALVQGNLSEVKEYVQMFPNNKIKFLLVVRNVDKKDSDGTVIGDAQYQAVYTRKTERPYSTDFSYLKKDIDDWVANGGGTKLEIPDYPYTLEVWAKPVPTEAPSSGESHW